MQITLTTPNGSKRWIALLVAALLVAGGFMAVAQAGPKGHGHGFDGKHMQRMMDAVGVDDTQRAQITSIIEAKKPEFKSLFKRMRDSRKSLKGQDPLSAGFDNAVAIQAESLAATTREMVILRAQMRKDIWQVLNEEQRLKASELMEKKRERRREKFLEKQQQS